MFSYILSNWGDDLYSKNDVKNTNEQEGIEMAVLVKPVNKITIVKEKNSQEFVREFNDNRVSREFLNSCKKAGKLFGKKK